MVKALMSPPTSSTASAMARADAGVGALEQQVLEEVRGTGERRRLVARPGATQKPTATERTSGMGSVTTVSPQSRRVVDRSGEGQGEPAPDYRRRRGLRRGASRSRSPSAGPPAVGRSEVTEGGLGLVLPRILEGDDGAPAVSPAP